MTKAYVNDEPGFLYPNKFKQPGDKSADFTGKLTVNGVERVVKAWRNQKEGKEYLSLRLKPAATPRAATRAEEAVAAGLTWPCPLCPGQAAVGCPLCKGSAKFDPAILVAARRIREARQVTGQDAADDLGMEPQRFYEMEDGRDIAPDAFGGPERRREVAGKLVVYLRGLGLLAGGR